jgi:hypothetical protein
MKHMVKQYKEVSQTNNSRSIAIHTHNFVTVAPRVTLIALTRNPTAELYRPLTLMRLLTLLRLAPNPTGETPSTLFAASTRIDDVHTNPT